MKKNGKSVSHDRKKFPYYVKKLVNAFKLRLQLE